MLFKVISLEQQKKNNNMLHCQFFLANVHTIHSMNETDSHYFKKAKETEKAGFTFENEQFSL